MFKSLFDPDSSFSRGMERVWSLVVLNVLWLLCSLPLVTLGASSTALYAVLGKMLEGEDDHVARRFLRAWRENWKQATPVWLVLLAVIALCGFDLWISAANERFLWELLAVAALQLVGMELTFVFPLMARYENTRRNHMKNALLVALGNAPRMLLAWLLWALPIGLCLFVEGMLLYLSLLWLLIGYSSLSYLTARVLRPIFRRLDENARK